MCDHFVRTQLSSSNPDARTSRPTHTSPMRVRIPTAAPRDPHTSTASVLGTVLIPKRALLLTMRFKFGYTGIRVRDLDKAIQFFTSVLGMKLQGRIKAPLNKGEFANLLTLDEKHWLEINWYADDSPVAGPFKEGDELDHLGFEVDDFDGALQRLKDAGYPAMIGPIEDGDWKVAFFKVVDGIWLDIYHITKKRTPAPKKKRKK
jgi:catechol 2,3-dioxygenase-like lactoylglutathione lyase family enzyme